MVPQNLPHLRSPRGRDLVYGVSLWTRAFFIVAGLAFCVFGALYSGDDGTLRLLGWAVGVLLLLSSVSEDRWTFRAAPAAGQTAGDAASTVDAAVPAPMPEDDPVGALKAYESMGGLKRRYGVLPVPRKWALPRDRLHSITIRAGQPGQGPNGSLSERDRMEASLQGMGRHPWVALVLNLYDGRSLIVAAGKPRLHARFRKDGEAIAAWLGLGFEDSSGLDR